MIFTLYGTIIIIVVLPTIIVHVDHNMLSGGTQPNLAYGAGSTWLQGANTDEGTGKYIQYILMKNVYSGADLGFLEWWGCKYKRARNARKKF